PMVSANRLLQSSFLALAAEARSPRRCRSSPARVLSSWWGNRRGRDRAHAVVVASRQVGEGRDRTGAGHRTRLEPPGGRAEADEARGPPSPPRNSGRQGRRTRVPGGRGGGARRGLGPLGDRKSTRLNSSHQIISYAVFCLKKKKN